MYHINNDVSYNNTTAVNFPYGEIHAFTDGHILFANAIKFLSKAFPIILDYPIGFLNFLMLFSIEFSFILLYLILRKFNLSIVFSIFGGVAIALLSPQLFRLLGHPSLSYSCMVPLTWYLQILFFEKQQWKYTIAIMLILVAVPFIHSYYILICGFFIFFTWLFSLISNRNIKYFKATAPHVFVQVFVPIILFQLYIKLVDTHIERCVEPFGLLDYVASFNTVFIPSHGPFKFIYDMVFLPSPQEWEGWSFIGTAVIIIVVITLLVNAILLAKNKFKLQYNNLPSNLKIYLYASVILLFYSFAYPFKWNMMYLLDYVPAMKQFRGLGRFAWVFFYVISVYAVYNLNLFYNYLTSKNYKVIAIILSLFLFSISVVEAYQYHAEVAPQLCKAPNQFLPQLLDEDYKSALSVIDKNKYQAIIPLPYFHVGSESHIRDVPDFTKSSAMYLAYYSKIPLLATSSGRTSIDETRKLMQLFLPSFLKKEAQADFKSKKPFLVMYVKDALEDNEQNILNKAHQFYANEKIILYELKFDDLFENTANAELAKFDNIIDSLFAFKDFLLTKNSKYVYYDNFDNYKSDTVVCGFGALRGHIKDYTILLENNKFQIESDEVFVASFWHHNRGSFVNAGMAVVEQHQPDGSENSWSTIYNISRCENIVGDWSLIELKFKLLKQGNTFDIFLLGNDKIEKYYYSDDLLIRPENVDVYKVIESKNGTTTKLYKNNFVIENF